jgi:hypothetical protein
MIKILEKFWYIKNVIIQILEKYNLFPNFNKMSNLYEGGYYYNL